MHAINLMRPHSYFPDFGDNSLNYLRYDCITLSIDGNLRSLIDKRMASNRRLDTLLANLEGIGDINSKKMYGGYGIFDGDKMFAVVDKNWKIFFKTDDSNRDIFLQANATKHERLPYYQVSDEIYDDKTKLFPLAESSIAIPKK